MPPFGSSIFSVGIAGNASLCSFGAISKVTSRASLTFAVVVVALIVAWGEARGAARLREAQARPFVTETMTLGRQSRGRNHTQSSRLPFPILVGGASCGTEKVQVSPGRLIALHAA